MKPFAKATGVYWIFQLQHAALVSMVVVPVFIRGFFELLGVSSEAEFAEQCTAFAYITTAGLLLGTSFYAWVKVRCPECKRPWVLESAKKVPFLLGLRILAVQECPHCGFKDPV